LFKFIKKRMLYRYIIVYLSNSVATVNIYDVKNLKILSHTSDDFSLENQDEFTDEVVEYINKKQSDVIRSYVVTLLNSQGQGIVPTCSATEFQKYSVDRRYIFNICIDKTFTNYASKIDIKWIQKTFAKTGIDIIFSPFILLYDLIKNEKDRSQVILYILYVNHSLTLMIAKDNKILYGAYHNISSDENPLYSSYDESDEIDISEEEFDIDELDLDSDDDFDLDDDSDLDEEKYISEVELVEENKGFAKFLSNTLKEFYSNKIYENNFVDKVKIYVEDDMDNSLLEYIENELFLTTEVFKIELDQLMIKYCQKEVIGV